MKTSKKQPFSVKDKSSGGDDTVVMTGYVQEDKLYIEDIIHYCAKHDIEGCAECQMYGEDDDDFAVACKEALKTRKKLKEKEMRADPISVTWEEMQRIIKCLHDSHQTYTFRNPHPDSVWQIENILKKMPDYVSAVIGKDDKVHKVVRYEITPIYSSDK